MLSLVAMKSNEIKSIVINALDTGAYNHEHRQAINKKNLLAFKVVDAKFVRNKISKLKEKNYRVFYDYTFKDREIHEIVIDGWYIKFYYENSIVTFISVHQ